MSADEVLAARAEALARPLLDHTQDLAQWLVLAVGDARIAIPPERAEIVLGPAPLARVPTAPTSAVVGIRARTGGGLLAVADLATLLDLVTAHGSAEQDVVVLADRTAPVGLLVDGVEGMRDLGTVTRLENDADLISGVGSEGELLLDVEAVLADPRLGGAATDDSHPTKGSS